MTFLKVKVEVENADEVIQKHKGKLVNMLSSLVMDEKKKKLAVEKTVYEKIMETLNEVLHEKLHAEGVDAQVSLKIVEEKEPSSN